MCGSTSSIETITTTPAAASCCGGSSAAPAESAKQADDASTTCPVMEGTPVVKADAVAAGLFRDYEGERYYLCCPACAPAFDADPARYAAAV